MMFFEEDELVLEELPTDENFRYVFTDLEGSLNAKEGDILQLAVIVTDKELNITNVYNEIYLNHKSIDPEEENIHKISQHVVDTFATRYFEDAFRDTALARTTDTTIISYTLFDIRRINEALSLQGKEVVDWGDQVAHLSERRIGRPTTHFDAFNISRSKLFVAMRSVDEALQKHTLNEVSQYMIGEGRGQHDALFDTANLLSLCRSELGYYGYKD